MRNYIKIPALKIAEEAINPKINKYFKKSNNKRDKIMEAFEYIEKEITKFLIKKSKINAYKAEEKTSGYLSHYPYPVINNRNYVFQPLCFCDKIFYDFVKCIHISETLCKYATEVVCIHLKDFTITTHKKGECPFTKYKAFKNGKEIIL